MPRPSKYKTRSKEKKRAIIEKTLELIKSGENLTKIAQSMNISRSSLRTLLANDELYTEYKIKQRQVLQSEFSKLAMKSAKKAKSKLDKASYKDLVVGAAIAYDKAYPVNEGNLVQVNVNPILGGISRNQEARSNEPNPSNPDIINVKE